MAPKSLLSLLLARRVVVIAGAGGVGKTTVAAALALSAAEQGRRVLCLTIDPAKRLFDRLGLDAASGAEQRVDPERFRAAGMTLTGELTLVMLDTKGTFDDLVRRYASSPEAARRILDNEFYHYISTQLAGTQAYMAMEKVLSVLSDERFDVIVLDTPPAADALDFLDAPERLIETLDSAALRWIADVFTRSGRMGVSIFARSIALVLRGVARLTGRGFLEHLAEFIARVNELFGGFRERAERVALAFRRPDFAYVLVAAPASAALDAAAFFADRLERLGMRADALVVNRTRPLRGDEPPLATVEAALRRHGIAAPPDLPERIVQAYRDERAVAMLERRTLSEHAADGTPLGRERLPVRVEIPAFPETVEDVAALAAMSRWIRGAAAPLTRAGVSSDSAP